MRADAIITKKDGIKLTDLQKRLLEMIKWFHCFCEEQQITYYLIEGTMIGAARHEGFIPWDDDIDVGLFREDYERLCRSFHDASGKYELHTPYMDMTDYYFSWSKLYDTTTTLIEKGRFHVKKGVYIDVFPIDNVGNTMKEAIKFSRKVNLLNYLLTAFFYFYC